MPFPPKSATKYTKKAKSPKKKRQFAHVANSMLKSGASEGSAIRAANAAVAGTTKPPKAKMGGPKISTSDMPRKRG